MSLIIPTQTAWTGVIISEEGEILTTSQTLGEAPIVDIRLWDGTRGQACVTGRDDDIGLALLRPLVEAARAYDYLALSNESPSTGQELELLQHARLSPVLYERMTTVTRHVHSNSGYSYFVVDAAEGITADGAVLLDQSDSVVGISMPPLWLLQRIDAYSGEVIAIDASTIARVALRALRSRRMQINTAPSASDYHFPPLPPIPVIFNGEMSIDGAPAPVGTLVHAKVSKEGQPDYWQSTLLGMTGEYVLPLSRDSSYFGGSVEFWVDCKRSPTAIRYEEPSTRAVELDLAF